MGCGVWGVGRREYQSCGVGSREKQFISREAQLFVGWVSGSVTHAGVGFHASTVRRFG